MLTNLSYKLTLAALFVAALPAWGTTREQRAALDGFMTRIGGSSAPQLIVTEVEPVKDAPETFTITARDGRPAVVGTTMSATTAGVNWYLNHYAHVNLAWNRPYQDLTEVTLPVPAQAETHACRVPYRYYLNYCTFSYSMAPWTWERWQREIDWMALHGVNMPLQIVGLDVVWRNVLTRHYGYSKEDANRFVAGPAFQAWWGMNNLEGWGGPNPDWWYTRQEQLARNILQRQRSLGMDPVLPGYAGMVPSDFQQKTGLRAGTQGKWCRFVRPYILDPNSKAFARVSKDYYKELHNVMGKSVYYSLDPFHEGAKTDSIDVPATYRNLRNAMVSANPRAKWVIQQWDWSKAQRNVLQQVEPGRLIVLDLFSDGDYAAESYGPHEAVFCTLPNFGGRTGLFGRLGRTVENWDKALKSEANIRGIGSAPEAIDQGQVSYDLAFELPWMDTIPSLEKWMDGWTVNRYGKDDARARQAWQLLRVSALDNRDTRQCPHEAVMCSRPKLKVKSASPWGRTALFYNPDTLLQAAHLMLDADLDGENYRHDLVDVVRQALTDRSKILLDSIRTAHERGDSTAFAARRDQFLELILDVDTLLSAHPSFMIGNWTEMARDIAKEVPGTTEADADWLDHNNARTLITVWGPYDTSEKSGLHEYAYRQKAGILRDLYYTRWRRWFDAGMPDNIDWYAHDTAWTQSPTRYATQPTPYTTPQLRALCRRLLRRHTPQ